MRYLLIALATLLVAAPAVAQPASAQPAGAPDKSADWPGLISGQGPAESFASGPELQRGRTAKWMLDDSRRVTRALAALAPQRKGTVDAYVLSVALDSDPVFGREAREAGKVLARRFDAAGRTLVFAGTDGSGPSLLPNGSLTSLTLGLARISEVMDKNEDVLVLYTTSHGAKVGIAYHDGNSGYGVLAPERLAALLDELGIRNRILILSACYSGIFVPALSSESTALFTAAASDRTSFGCVAENDWTFFGDAMINQALRKPQPLARASDEARMMIGEWESRARLPSSDPQVSMGSKVAAWLSPLEARMPRNSSAPVGRPAIETLQGE